MISPAPLSPSDYSVPGNVRAEAFARFARPHLRGHVLDVGCGAAALPLYLSDYPTDFITGVDPEPAPHPFRFEQACAERLSFSPDRWFQTVICATVLDHVADPPAALQEIARVLSPGGAFVSWETVVSIGEDGPDEHHAFRFTYGRLMALFASHFALQHAEEYREGMRAGCAEFFSVWGSK